MIVVIIVDYLFVTVDKFDALKGKQLSIYFKYIVQIFHGVVYFSHDMKK